MTTPDRGPDGPEGEATPHGWTRNNWLAEKIQSGELPAADSDLTQRCDAFFVASAGIEVHVRLMATMLAGDAGERRFDVERRLAGLRESSNCRRTRCRRATARRPRRSAPVRQPRWS